MRVSFFCDLKVFAVAGRNVVFITSTDNNSLNSFTEKSLFKWKISYISEFVHNNINF